MAWEDFDPPAGSFASLYLSANWNDSRLVDEIIEQDLDEFREQQPGIFPHIQKMKEGDSFERLWMFEEDYPSVLTGTTSGTGTVLTVTGNLFGAAVTRAAVLNCGIRAGTILRYDYQGTTTITRVASVDATLPVINMVVDTATDTPTDGAGQTWRIVSSPFTDAKPYSSPTMLDRDFLYSTTEIIENTFGIEKSRAIVKMAGGIDEVRHQLKKCLEKHMGDIARAVTLQHPVISSGVPQSIRKTEEPRLCGLLWWPKYLYGSGGKWENSDIYKNMSGSPVLMDDWNALATAMWNNGTNFSKGKWECWVAQDVFDQMQKYDQFFRQMDYKDKTAGYEVEMIKLYRIPKPIPVKVDPIFPEGYSTILDMTAPRWSNVKGDRLVRKEMPMPTSRSRVWQLTQQIEGVELRRAKTSMGVMYYIGS